MVILGERLAVPAQGDDGAGFAVGVTVVTRPADVLRTLAERDPDQIYFYM